MSDTNRFENGERKYEETQQDSEPEEEAEKGQVVATTVRCEYCGQDMTPFNPTAEAHICRTCLLDIQVGGRVEDER